MPIYKERAAGIYRATYLGCEDKSFTDKETGEEVTKWLWRFQETADPLSTGELALFTNRSMRSPNSNAYKMATGILGHKPQPGDDTEAMVGQTYDVVYGPNQAGNLAITSVVKVNAEPVPVPATPAVPLPELP